MQRMDLTPRELAELIFAVARGMLMLDVLRPQEMTAAERRDAATGSDTQTLAFVIQTGGRTRLCMTWPKSISNVPVQSNARPRRRWRSVGIAMGLLAAILVFAFGIKVLQIAQDDDLHRW